MTKYKMDLDITNLDGHDVEFIHKFLKLRGYMYADIVEEYDPLPEEFKHMTMFEYEKGLDKTQMKKFIYWVYSCGN